MLKYMNPFQTELPKVLLTGNGINRAFKDEDWDKLLKDMASEEIRNNWEQIKDLPYPLKVVAATDNHVDTQIKASAKNMIQISNSEEKNSLINQILECNFDAILTTNYTYEIEQAWNPEFHIQLGKASKYRHKTCKDKSKDETLRLYQYLQVNDDMPPIWHIHGEAAKPDSVILGHYYYGKLLSRIQTYTAETIRRYLIKAKHQEEFYPRSWVDYLLFGDVYILGQGLDFSEMDLWWLLECKKRHQLGKVYWCTKDCKDGPLQLAKAYGVEVIKQYKEISEYEKYYAKVLEELKGDN